MGEDLTNLLKLIGVFWILAMCLPTLSYAQISDMDLRDQALELATKIESENLVIGSIDNQGPAPTATDQLRFLRNALTDAIFDGLNSDDKNILEEYVQAVASTGHDKDRNIEKLFREILIDDADPSTFRRREQIKELAFSYLNNDDWFVAHRANYIIAALTLQSPAIALEHAITALKLIPVTESAYVSEAKLLSTHQISSLHNLMGNPRASIPLSFNEIELSLELGDPVDGATHINNLIYAFALLRDHQTSQELLKVLLRIEERNEANYPGLTDYRAAEIYAQMGEYQQAFNHAETSYKLAENDRLRNATQIYRIISLAGLKRTSEAQTLLNAYEAQLTNGNTNPKTKQNIIHAKALIALSKGDTVEADRLFAARLDSTVQNILETKNTQSEGMLASLQNSKDRRDEREAALQRETDLKQAALDKQKSYNHLLLILAGILGLSSLATFAFARYRSKVAENMEEAAKQARAGEKAKSEFLGVMSHELRTPLNGILGMADYLSREAPTQDLRDKNDIILKSGQDLLDLVENIMDMTLIENDEIKPYIESCDIRKIISKSDAFWQQRIFDKDVTLTSFVSETVPTYFESDKRRLSQCLNILMSNATKFTEAGRVHIHVTHDADILKIIVADTGVGIRQEVMDNLFKPFVQADASTTRKYGGAGIGLTVAHSLCRILGGELRVKSRVDRGSEFTLTFRGRFDSRENGQNSRLKKLGATTNALSVANIPTKITGMKIYQCDNDTSSKAHIGDILRQKGFEIITNLSDNGATDEIAIINLDHEKNPLARVRSLRQFYPNLPIIALTSAPAASDTVNCMMAGINMFLTLPVGENELVQSLDYFSRDQSPANSNSASIRKTA